MKLDSFVKHVRGTSLASAIEFLDADKSGEIYTFGELKEKIPGLSQTRLYPRLNPDLLKYTLITRVKGNMKLFYGNPAVIKRAEKYAAT